MPTPLPIDPLLPTLVRHVEEHAALVLEAPPGAGKTTRVPPALLGARGMDGEIVVLEPRRIATRMAAARVAEEMGTRLGDLVGYTVRFDDVSSAKTRIRFVTEGVLTRRLLRDRTLARVSCVVLDEFHERHLHGDVALALLRRLQLGERPDLKIVVMSATLDAAAVASHLGTTAIRSEGKSYAVTIEHDDKPDDRALELRVASAVRRALDDDGDILVFLPGAAEIRRAGEACAAIAAAKGALVLPLHGELPPAEQDRAVKKNERRKLILATNVAESSLTIDGVTTVVDSGLVRRAGFAAWSGLPTLKVEKTSRASAIQRAGRAGRTRPGRAIRLYSRADFAARPKFDVPEIARMDLAQTLLELRASGIGDVPWLDPPPSASIEGARVLLQTLGALDAAGDATAIGRELLRYPAHPRIARVIVDAAARGVAADGCAVAAVLGERDLRADRGDRGAQGRRATERSDVIALVDLLREAEESGETRSALRAIGLDELRGQAALRTKRELLRLVPKRDIEAPRSPKAYDDAIAQAILAGFVDRVARRVSSRTFALAGGGTAELAETSLVRDAPFVVAVDAESRGASGSGKPTIRLASAIEPEWLMDLVPGEVVERDVVEWNAERGRVDAVSRLEFRGIEITETRASATPSEAAGKLLFEAATRRGGFGGASSVGGADLAARITFARRYDPSLPAIDEDAAKTALATLCADRTSLEELEGISLEDALRGALGPALGALERLAPTKITLRSTRVVPVHYDAGKDPWIEARLQDFFGQTTTPTLATGRFNLVVHLLAPNARAVQVTTDLAGFWSRHYATIRKELMRKYPRHAWPEDPLTAEPQLKPAQRKRR
ncbi:ATP-dependent helicase HrpB [soil metagenome]